jgi:hypothetical protein
MLFADGVQEEFVVLSQFFTVQRNASELTTRPKKGWSLRELSTETQPKPSKAAQQKSAQTEN